MCKPVATLGFFTGVMRTLSHLTNLQLCFNKFPCLPPALTELTRLEVIDINHNAPLQLSEGCLEVLEALPRLHTLGLWPCKEELQ